MLPFFEGSFGNASSVHVMGRKAAAAVAHAREAVAGTIGCSSEEVLFTSGATESNNIVLLGIANRQRQRRRILLTAIEHKSVLDPCGWLAQNGFDVVQIPVTRDGVANAEAARQLIDNDTLLVCIHGANNEIGTLQPVAAIAQLAHSRGALVHCDATQMLGKVPVSVDELGVDFASFSGHKIYGPKGVGALFVRRNTGTSPIEPVYRGGGQESGLRPGTSNVPGIVGLGVACGRASQCLLDDGDRIKMLRNFLEQELLQTCPGAFAVGVGAERLPGTTSICFTGVPADALLVRTPLVCAGIGSACTSGAIEPSHVLLACGLSRDIARCVIRLSIGRCTTREEVEIAARHLSEGVGDILRNCCSHC